MKSIQEPTTTTTTTITTTTTTMHTAKVGWATDKGDVSFKAVQELGEYNGGKLYGYIHEDYATKSRENALGKGFAARAHGCHGVKLLDKKLFELEAGGDAILYTTELYKNASGDFLAYFAKEKNHKGIEREVRNSKRLVIHEVEDAPVISELMDSSIEPTDDIEEYGLVGDIACEAEL